MAASPLPLTPRRGPRASSGSCSFVRRERDEGRLQKWCFGEGAPAPPQPQEIPPLGRKKMVSSVFRAVVHVLKIGGLCFWGLQ